MRLFRFGPSGKERPGVLDVEGVPRDASAVAVDYGEAFFGEGGLTRLAQALGEQGSTWPIVDLERERLGPPVARPSKILGIGLNYRDHAAETGARLPSEPKIFMKATTALSSVTDDVLLPPDASQLDHEVELAVVLSRTARRVSIDDAVACVAGYTICNDYSERDWQKNRDGQFVKGKSFDSFAPLGPYLVTPDELDVSDVRLWCSVNDELRQDSRTSEMVFQVAELIAALSTYMTLLPGDVITTGTPQGVGMGRNPPLFLKAGDRVTYGIEGIGEGSQVVVPLGQDLS